MDTSENCLQESVPSSVYYLIAAHSAKSSVNSSMGVCPKCVLRNEMSLHNSL